MVSQKLISSKRLLAVFVATLSCALSPLQLPLAAVAQDATTPYQATWPVGWTKTELPGPRPYSEKDLGGKRIRLTKMDAGALGAIIELTYFPRPGAAQVNLDEEFGTYLNTVKTGYEAKGYTVTEGAPVKSMLGGLKDMESDITTMANGRELQQFNAMAIGSDSFYSFSYSGLKENFEKYKADFEACKKSLVLK